ncbi:transglutaminase-like domain-containing protein [Tsuneonella troitsensis]|jgi:transglutaminase-like putative cysteine protease|uniref:transglutaminase-like domain-containing protein n=1 Tax=Tsuneonella troitsensis TaxID=292222 RepID=UPI00070FBF41|nr:transglutaminase family protein [Tsuneonella troitsensis]OGS51376.1 MAG: transglutaminase [Erythrobacter sp. RIFCSPHIGHO2_12_FULL_63_10]
MTIAIKTRFDFSLDNPTDVILQFEAAEIPEQVILSANTVLTCGNDCARVPAHEAIGERVLVRAEGRFEVEYDATVDVRRLTPDLAGLAQLSPHDLPGDPLEYLLDSRYCPADRLQSFVEDEFGGTSGGDRALAIRDWIAKHFTYEPGSSTATTTALDTFVERRGICRDYAHVLITLARASTIPARYVSCFAPGVTPPDFHAVAEVFLADETTPGGGAWYILDATGMAEPHETVKIGVGRDAADVSFLTSFGPSNFGDKSVEVARKA